MKRISGDDTVIKIQNGYQSSVMTFAAIPQSGGDPVHAIMTSGEARTLTLKPGAYKVTVTVADTGYPPSTLLKSDYEMTFAGGSQYSRVFSHETTQQ